MARSIHGLRALSAGFPSALAVTTEMMTTLPSSQFRKRLGLSKQKTYMIFLKELGFRRNLPKGRFTVRSLAEQFVVRRDFNKKSWTNMAANVLDEEIPQDTTDLAVGVLTTAVQN